MRVLRDRDRGLCLCGPVVSGFGTSALWLASGAWVKDLTGSDGRAALCVLALCCRPRWDRCWALSPTGSAASRC